MAIKKAPPVTQADAVNRVINAGSPPVDREQIDDSVGKKEIKFVMTIPEDLAETIEKVRGRSKTSRRSWFLLAALEKLKKDGEL
jgi:hypothetical protein